MSKSWYWCERCNTHWEGEDEKECPVCGEKFDIRKTMSKEEAKKLGLTE